MLPGFFRSDIEGIENVGVIVAVFEQVFLGLRKFASDLVIFNYPQRFSFLAGFVFVEAVVSATDPGLLNGENKVLIV